jgi:DNA mismatch repair protein MutS2
MTQSGLHIPAQEDAVMPVFADMYVDIGDEQSIESDLSTFSSHLTNLTTIVRGASSRSLVLIDEIGTGTDPAEGGALAAAVLERLTQIKALTIATTHHGALKMFAHETPAIENGAMEFDQKTLAPTYRFRPGVPGSSYALEMADRLGFPRDLMDRARALLGGDHMRLDTLLQELEASAQEHRETSERLKADRARAEALVIEHTQKLSALTRESRELKRKAAEDARAIVERANTAIEQAVKAIREQNASREAVREARTQITAVRSAIEEIAQATDPEAIPEPASGGPLAPGIAVVLTGKTEVGEIEAMSADGRSATVVFGVMRMRVPVTELETTRKRKTARQSPASSYPGKPEEVERELDLRGMTGDEALPLVDKFIDAAILAGLHRVDVIHGKGTGALRRRVTEFLANHHRVRSYRLGEWNEGGTGATVIELGDQ